MTVNVNAFRPKLVEVRQHDSSTYVVVVGVGDTHLNLFFMHDDGDTQIQIIKFVTELLHEAGFDYYEFDASPAQCCDAHPDEFTGPTLATIHNDGRVLFAELDPVHN